MIENHASNLQNGSGVSPRRTLEDAPLIGALHWTLTGGVTDANDVFLSLLGYTRDDLRAGRIDWWELTPAEWRSLDADGMVQVREMGRHLPFEKEFFRRDGTRVPVLIGSALYPDSATHGVSFVLDISDRKAEERGALERTIQGRVAGVLESMGDAFVALDSDFRITYMNAKAEQLTGGHRNDFIGKSHWDVWPASVGTELERQYRQVAQDKTPAYFENFYEEGDLRRWFEVRAFPADDGGINIFYRDITESHAQEDALRAAHAQTSEILESISDAFYAVDADFRFTYVNRKAEVLWGRRREDLIGKELTVEFPHASQTEAYRYLQQVAREGQPAHFETASSLLGKPVEVSMYPTASGGLSVYFRDITERHQMEQERERLLEEARARAEREALVNRIADGVRQALPPEEIQAVALAALGQSLAADRCFVFTVTPRRDALVISRDWHAEGSPPIAGVYKLSELGLDLDAVFATGSTLVVSDSGGAEQISEQNAAVNRSLRVRSFVNVPFYEDGRIVGALGVAMATLSRTWTETEVALVETVAGQLRATVEAARLQQRERNIARQLQAALQPPPPPSLPGLSLEGFYRPALEEAGVGGDFFDVFSLEKHCTALVVGDLSGKGLSAASEVATVRNMVRYALYAGRTLDDAIGSLNRILDEQDLLSGFATLFVGVYDHSLRTLTYVNCGQEPGLVRRSATGDVEMLHPTGPVLGGFAEGLFTQATQELTPGDVLCLFTDGMTEVGPNRGDLLEVSGVAQLLQEGCRKQAPCLDARKLTADLVTGVDAYGQGGVRDDIALLVGIVGAMGEPQWEK